MKSYLSIVSVSAKVHKRRNRMTLFCIIISVFLVTGIFSMVNAAVEAEKRYTTVVHGNWHIKISGLPAENLGQITSYPDVAAVSMYETANFDMEHLPGRTGSNYKINGVKTALCGIDQPFVTDIMHYFDESASVAGKKDIILSANAKKLLGVNKGDSITLDTPFGSYNFAISGFRLDDKKWISADGGEDSAVITKENEIAAFINTEVFHEICNSENPDTVYYIQLKKYINARRAFSGIKEQCKAADKNIEINKMLMATMGFSDSQYIMNTYGIAACLLVMVLLAGIFMISGSLNSNIAERLQFFGMMRCIGASKKQIMRIVRLEALNWCKTAIPVGILSGVAATCGLCALIKFFVGGSFSEMPVFIISIPGVLSGFFAGLVTVLVAAQQPAKRASKVPPASAVSGGASDARNINHAANTRFFKIETALGASHAVSSRKRLFLMTCSFALSIILFLCFSVLIEFFGYVMPDKIYAPDFSIASGNYSNTLDTSLYTKLSNMPGIKEVYGRTSVMKIPATFSKEAKQDTINIISYNELQLNWLPKDDDLYKGSDLPKVLGNSKYILLIYDSGNPLRIGDKVWINGEELEIAGMLKCSPFSNDGKTGGEIDIICSEETCARLTGEKNYGIIDMHVEKDITEPEINAIKAIAKDTGNIFQDRRTSENGLFVLFKAMVYGFLFIIALISMFNIINSISMSVSARTRQYGAMRAVGMEGRQLSRMISAEAYTYAFFGCIFGCGIGLPASKVIYTRLVTAHFGDLFCWTVPVHELLVILVLMFVSVAIAVYRPSKRIRDMAVTDAINEL